MNYVSAHQPPFSLHGLVQEAGYRRLPMALMPCLRPPLARLATQTSGGRIRFATDAKRIAVRITLADTILKTHMTPLNMAGAELYAGSRRVALLRPKALGAGSVPFEALDGYGIEKVTEHTIALSGQMETYTLYLPAFAAVEDVTIGLPEEASLCSAEPYAIADPIVFYGSSITHGACAGRPSLTYPARVAAALNADFINLGFAGNALGDPEVAQYIARLPMSLFVLDYDENAPDAAHLLRTHKPFFDIVRSAQPDVPILMLTHIPSGQRTHEELEERCAVIRRTYDDAVACGDRNVAFLDGRTLFDAHEADQCLMDFIHPNDYGFACMARGILPVVSQMLKG